MSLPCATIWRTVASMASQKKVVLRQLDGKIIWGYLPSSGFVVNQAVELLDPAGRVLRVPLTSVKMVCFVRNFNLDDAREPEQIGKKAFLTKPRMEGLWLRIAFSDGDRLEGIAHFDLQLLDSLVSDHGIVLIPPDTKSNTVQAYIPRTAIAQFDVLGCVSSPGLRQRGKTAASSSQVGLFEGKG